ncbi:MAG: hypothetical protein ACR2QJ_15405, partial [Geminicoccaceae bacterium]
MQARTVATAAITIVGCRCDCGAAIWKDSHELAAPPVGTSCHRPCWITYNDERRPKSGSLLNMPGTTGRTSLFKRITSIISIFVLSIVILEIMTSLYVRYGLDIKRSEYLDRYIGNPNFNTITWVSRYKPHPYFGYEHQAIQDLEKKEFSKTDDFVVAILGGSVANSLGKHVRSRPDYFENIRSFIPDIGSKEIIIENLALGAGKQPQQFFISSFFLDKFDMVINIDGFNEASPDHFLPLYPLEFPTTSLKYLERSDGGQVYAGMGRLVRSLYVLMHDLPASHPRLLAQSSVYFAFWHHVHPRLFKLIRTLQKNYHDAAMSGERQKAKIPNDIIMDKRIDIWKRYTEMQFKLTLSISKKPTFFFVQPNQYLEGSKPLTNQEKTVAINDNYAKTSSLRAEKML